MGEWEILKQPENSKSYSPIYEWENANTFWNTWWPNWGHVTSPVTTKQCTAATFGLAVKSAAAKQLHKVVKIKLIIDIKFNLKFGPSPSNSLSNLG